MLLSAHSSQFSQIYQCVFYDITTGATNPEICTHRGFNMWDAVMVELQLTSMTETICHAFSEAIIKFGETKFSVNEPKESGQMSVVKIPVLRVGDTSKVSVVRVHTKDGSATSGEDYHPISEGK